MTTTTEITQEWILQIVEDDRHRQELAQMIAEIQSELIQQPKKIIPKRPFENK